MEQLPGGLRWGRVASVVPSGSAPEVVEVQRTQGVFHIIGHGLERDLTEEAARDLFGLGTKVRMRREQTVQNGLGLAGSEPLEDRGLRRRCSRPGCARRIRARKPVLRHHVLHRGYARSRPRLRLPWNSLSRPATRRVSLSRPARTSGARGGAAARRGTARAPRRWWGSPLVRCCYVPSVPPARRTAWMSRRSNRRTSSSSLTVTCDGSTLRTEPRRARDQGSARPGADPTTRSTGTPASWAP